MKKLAIIIITALHFTIVHAATTPEQAAIDKANMEQKKAAAAAQKIDAPSVQKNNSTQKTNRVKMGKAGGKGG
jgi:hypothetical protein